jgi:hypothetical protein
MDAFRVIGGSTPTMLVFSHVVIEQQVEGIVESGELRVESGELRVIAFSSTGDHWSPVTGNMSFPIIHR